MPTIAQRRLPPPSLAPTAKAAEGVRDRSDVTIDDPDLEAEIRLKLKKPKETNPARAHGEGPRRRHVVERDEEGLARRSSTRASSRSSSGSASSTSRRARTAISSRSRTSRKLEALRASISEVEDLKPLEKLVLLDQLDLGRTHVRDILRAREPGEPHRGSRSTTRRSPTSRHSPSWRSSRRSRSRTRSSRT